MIVEIKYRDKTNWESITGNVIDWTNYSKKFKEDRVQPWFVLPEIITDTWNGKETDIQHSKHDVWFFEFFLKESEKHDLAQIKSCSDVQIITYVRNDAGQVLTTTYTLDTSKSDYIDISEPESLGNTSGSKVQVIFRTNRTVIDKCLPVENTNDISFGMADTSTKVS